MPERHSHQWKGHESDRTMLTCTVLGCNTMSRITDLLEKYERYGVELGRYDMSVNLLGRHAMLTQRGRKTLNTYVTNSTITKRIDGIKKGQVRLV